MSNLSHERSNGFPIAHVELTPQLKERLTRQVISGNRVMRQMTRVCADRLGLTRAIPSPEIRSVVFPFLDANPDGGEIAALKYTLTPREACDIAAAREAEPRLLGGHVALVIRRVSKALASHPPQVYDREDYWAEAIWAAVNAIYNFDSETLKLTTYLTTAVDNAIRRFSFHDKPMTHWRRDDYWLVTTDEDDLSHTDRAVRRQMLGSSVTESHCDDNGEWGDPFANTPWNPITSLEVDEREAIANAGLTPFEAACLEAFASTPTGQAWQTKVASRFINPKTNKPYTNTTAHNAFENAKRKIRDAYQPTEK